MPRWHPYPHGLHRLGNQAGGGGGLYTTGESDLTNCTFSGNTASGVGGGIESYLTLNVTNCTIVDNNSSATCGGGIYVQTGRLSIGNTILAANNSWDTSEEGGSDVNGTFNSLGNNIVGQTDLSTGWISSDLTGTAIFPFDPKVSPLGFYGGPTQTLPPLAGSPAIDAGNDGLVPGLPTDQRGLNRVVNTTVDIGAVEIQPAATGSISGTVFGDLNSNGNFDTGETGIPNVTVYIDANLDGVFDTGDTPATTDLNGNFTFPNLPAGTYRIREVLPAGYTLTTPVAGYFDVPLTAGGNAPGYLFGDALSATGNISGTVFADNNSNGVYDPGEVGIPGTTVYIDTNGNGTLDAGEISTATDGSGNYSFTNLPPGTYRIREVLPAGDVLTVPTAGYYIVPLSAGQNKPGYNFGDGPSPTGSISGEVFFDTNANGNLDAGEPGIANATVYIDANGNGTLDAGETKVVTNSSGNYMFSGLAAGTYRIRQIVPAGDAQTAPTGGFYSVPLVQNGTATGYNFGDTIVATASLSGKVFEDNNANGKLDTGEPGVPNATVYIDANHNGILDAGDTSLTTDSNGNFTFNNLPAGTYTIREILPSGQMLTVPTSGFYTVPLSAGQAATGYLFGNAPITTASISGEVFVDSDGNGKLDTGEKGLANVTVFIDANGNGKLDAGEVKTVSGSTGNFSFTGLPAGTYRIAEVLPGGYTLTDPTAGFYSVPLATGQAATGYLFGNAPAATASISGEVFTDANGNGSLDSGEKGLPNVTVFIDANGNGKLDAGEVKTTSDSNGNFSFTSLPAGTYRIAEVIPPGYKLTDPVAGFYNVTLTAGHAATGYLFGNAPTTITTPTGGTITGSEGRLASGTVASFSASYAAAPTSDFSATVAWADGTTSAGTIVNDGGGHFHVTASHAYMEEGTSPYALKVTIKEVNNGSVTVTGTAKISDSVIDTPAAVAGTATHNVAFSNKILGSFRDQDSLNTISSDYIGTITWGDGSTSAASFVRTGGTFNVGTYWNIVGSHTYAAAKTYTVTISFYDNGSPALKLTITTTIKVS